MVFLKSIKRNMLIISLMYCAVGYLLIADQGENFYLIIDILSIGLGLAGLFSMIGYILLPIAERYKRNDFIMGALLVILAIFVYYEVGSFPEDDLAMIFGMAMIMSAIIKVQDLFDSRAVEKKVTGTYFGLAVICAVIGLFTWKHFLIPGTLSYYFSGIGMIFCGLTDLGSNFYLAASRSDYEARLKKEKEQEMILEDAENKMNAQEASEPVSFEEDDSEKQDELPEERKKSSINIELSDKEKNSNN